MIHLLPSFFTTDSMSEEQMMATKCNQKFPTIADFVKKIKQNIVEISKKKKEVAEELSESLEIQIQIICHGYEGVFPNDTVANDISNFIKENS